MRYTEGVRLKFIGDRGECQKYLARARTILGEVWNRDIVIGELSQSWRTVWLDENTRVSVYATVFDNPQITIDVTPKNPEIIIPRGVYELHFRWVPEGILLTPTTLANKGGWGLPRRSNATGEKYNDIGTEYGLIPQCLLNRYENNLYYDNPNMLVAELENGVQISDLAPDDYIPPRTRDSYEAEAVALDVPLTTARRASNLVSWAEPDEDEEDYIFAEQQRPPGVYFQGKLLLPQSAVIELAKDLWYCHRPEELLYESPIHEAVYQESNLLRQNVAELPVSRPLRGEPDAAVLGASVLAGSEDNVFAHSYKGWNPGTRTATARDHLCHGYSPYGWFNNNVGENILFYESLPPDVSTPEEVGEYIVSEWAASPRHYDNIVNASWTANLNFPWHPWVPRGTWGGYMEIAGVAPVTVEQVWTPNLSTFGYELSKEDPPLNGTVWTQVFSTRETWLPVYSVTQEFDLGITGLTGASCPYNRDYYRTQRRFGYNGMLYDIPEGNVKPAFFTFAGDAEDDFLTCLGSAPYTRDGRVWIRAAYWESSEARTPYPRTAAELENRYGRLVVVTFPDGLTDTASLPWREDEEPEKWQVEFERTFTVQEGWVPECEAQVQFSPDGNKFLIELEKAGDEFIYEGISRENRFTFLDFGRTIDDLKVEFDWGLFNIQRVAFEYEAVVVPQLDQNLPTVTEGVLTEIVTTPPIRAQVSTGYAKGNGRAFYYEVTVAGEYKIWPHYDAKGKPQFVVLVIDERWYQYERPTSGGDVPLINQGDFVDPSNPYILSANRHRGYRHRKMVFPSGKEVVYMQQYVVHNFAVSFDAENPPPGYNFFPGSGECFYAVIHYLDLATETLIYSKHGTNTYFNYDNLDPNGNAVPNEFWADYDPIDAPASNPQPSWSWTTGDSVYLLDAFTDTDRVEETLADYPASLDSPLRYQPMSQEFSAGQFMITSFGHDLYPAGHTPYTFFSFTGSTGSVFAFNTQMMFPGIGFADVSTASFLGTGDAANDFFRAMPIQNFDVTVSTRRFGRGEDANTALRFAAGERYYGQLGSGAYFNVAPLFSGEDEVRAKFVAYDGRWIARLEVRHINRNGLKAPPLSTQPRASAASYAQSEFLYTKPHDAEEKDGYVDSLVGRFTPIVPQAGEEKTAVHLKANFDLDTAVGISDVYDIEPFGRL